MDVIDLVIVTKVVMDMEVVEQTQVTYVIVMFTDQEK